MRLARLWWSGAVVALLAVGGCGGSADRKGGGDAQPGAAVTTAAASAGPVTLQAEFTGPKPDHVLQIGVQSATRTGDRIALVLTGTYGGNRTTRWDATSVNASTGAGQCQVTADPGFPQGSSRPGSVVTGTWTLTCSGGGPVHLVVDPFGGLLDSDTSFRITLR
ncbi:hypothetical protein [Dactylosporangium sp. CA-092794]|uniref:hypothetical protein n=1 Tax=Dactylosporangium sp. CA-092794 TaxID=3239929 RepID=UPI003D8E8CE0